MSTVAGLYDEVIEKSNNELALELKLVGCDKVRNSAFLYGDLELPSFIRLGAAIHIDTMLTESFYSENTAMENIVYSDVTVSVLLTGQQSIMWDYQGQEMLTIISDLPLGQPFPLSHHNFARHALIYGTFQYAIDFNTSSHSMICGRVWKLQLRFQSLTFQNLSVEPSVMFHEQMVFIICDIDYVSLFPNIRDILPQVVFPSITYPVTFKVLRDNFMSTNTRGSNETMLSVKETNKVEVTLILRISNFDNATQTWLPMPIDECYFDEVYSGRFEISKIMRG